MWRVKIDDVGSSQGRPWLHHACPIDVLTLQTFSGPGPTTGKLQNIPRPGGNLTLTGADSWSTVHSSTSPNAKTNGVHILELNDFRSPPSCCVGQPAPEAPTTDASRVQLVHVHLCGASPCRWVLARRVCARVKPDLHNKSRLLPLSFRPNNFSTSLILHLPTEHTCIGVNDGTLLRSEEGLARTNPRLWSSCPGSLSMPWPQEARRLTWASPFGCLLVP